MMFILNKGGNKVYRIVNITSGEIVCNLANGRTLRVESGATQIIEDTEMTPYLSAIEKKGLIMCTFIKKDNVKVVKKPPKTNKDKEE